MRKSRSKGKNVKVRPSHEVKSIELQIAESCSLGWKPGELVYAPWLHDHPKRKHQRRFVE